jgi:hypothetical protein
MSCTWTTISIYYLKVAKNLVPKFIHMKKKLWEEGQYFFKVILLVHYILFAPK